MICSLNFTCRVSARLSQSLPALSEHSVFLYVSHVCIALNIQHIMQNTWGNYGIFFMKTVTFRVLFTEGGYPLEKGPKKGPKFCYTHFTFWSHFRAKVSIGTLPKKHEILGCPQNGPKAAFGRPGCPNGAQKGAFWRSFWYLFRVRCQK